MTLVYQDLVDADQRIQMLGGVQLPSERAHAQVCDAGLLPGFQNREPLGFGSIVHAESTLSADVGGVLPMSWRQTYVRSVW